ncbi:hypothetical protein [Rhizobium sp. L245/93]|uniref:hypothetical protein n=1 Tax=Rhizobium sp. L245/93 TaxID=2819998 RepID=UPI001ADA3AA2|nr:hypothetical protein [Rhizobium sp. L245/93]MBO9170437.1 hypothetical protein [Rhizobium sp. L245/93]
MTDDMMKLRSLVAKSADADLLREILAEHREIQTDLQLGQVEATSSRQSSESIDPIDIGDTSANCALNPTSIHLRVGGDCPTANTAFTAMLHLL